MRKFLFALTFVLSIFMATSTQAGMGPINVPGQKTLGERAAEFRERRNQTDEGVIQENLSLFDDSTIETESNRMVNVRQKRLEKEAEEARKKVNSYSKKEDREKHKAGTEKTKDIGYGNTFITDKDALTKDVAAIVNSTLTGKKDEPSKQAMLNFQFYANDLQKCTYRWKDKKNKNGETYSKLVKECNKAKRCFNYQDENGNWKTGAAKAAEDERKKTCANTAGAYLQELSKQAYQAVADCDRQAKNMPQKTDQDKQKRAEKLEECVKISSQLGEIINEMKNIINDKYDNKATKDLCTFGTAQVRTYNFNERLKTFYGISGEADGSNLLGAELKSIMEFGKGCWFCGIFEKIFDLINELATRLYALLSEWFQALLAIMGFAAILFMVGKFFLTFHGTNIGQEYTNLFQMIGRMILAFALLHASVGEVFGLFIRPFFSFTGALVDAINAVESPAAGGMVISLSQINITQTGNCSAEDLQGVANQIQAEVKSMCIDETPNPYGTFTFDGKEAAFDATMRSVLVCMLKTTSAALLVGMAQGAATMELSDEDGFKYKDIIPNFGMLIFGLIQFIAFLYLYIMTPIKLLDVLIRFGFVAIMMPLWIVFWVFKTTRGYTKKAWDIVMTSLFYLVSLTIMLLLALKILGA